MSTMAYSVIVPVWGAAHVSRFLDWVLPTWLSPGNLPALAAGNETELILLAPRADLDRIMADDAVSRLRDICRFSPIEIDDLVPGGIATVTLTLAFTRGARAAIAQGNRRLVFLNADFVLSDGSIASIARRFDAGQKLLLCASIRVKEELVFSDLLAHRQPNRTIAIEAREAVRLALEAIHPTALACRVDQPLLHSSHPNQFFWRIDSESLLLRAFLLFPLAVEPEAYPGAADIYCDYGWIRTFAPNAPVEIIQSSDELFIIELAPTRQEGDFVRSGPLDPADAARRVSVWANEFSRAQPLKPIIFNAGELSTQASTRISENSLRFVTDLLQRLGPPTPASNHPYWIAGAAAYLRNRKHAGIDSIPSELAKPDETALASQSLALNSTLRSVATKVLVGRSHDRRLWHPYWAMERRIKALGRLRIVGDATVAERFKITSQADGVPTAGIDLRNLRGLDEFVRVFAAAVPSGGRAYLIVDQGASGAGDLLNLNERMIALARLESFFKVIAAPSLVTRLEETASITHRRLATDLHLVSPLKATALMLASGLALVQIWWQNLRFGDQKPNHFGDPALILELQRY
jgi:hypothetical protein